MLNPHLVAVLLLEGPEETRVPELRRDAEVLAAAHQGVGLAALAGGRDRVFGKVAALATGLADESTGLRLDWMPRGPGGNRNLPAVHNQRVLPRHHLLSHNQLASRCQTPASWAKCRVQDSPILDFGKVYDAVGLDLDVFGVNWRLEDRGGLGAEGARREPVERGRPVNGATAIVESTDGTVSV